ncbi:MAG: trypsin-like serine protease [Planctomycetes bacterium]|nr:trypsin-like serine protease [Planctomycetota bacterium]
MRNSVHTYAGASMRLALVTVMCLAGRAIGQAAPTVPGREIAPGPGVFVAPTKAADLKNEELPFPPVEEIPGFEQPWTGTSGAPTPGLRQDIMRVFNPDTGEISEIPGGAFMGRDGGGEAAGAPGADGQMASSYADRSFGTMTQVLDTSAAPWRQNVRIAFHVTAQDGAQGWFVCSGSLIDARTVITAGHCVYTRSAKFADGQTHNVFAYADQLYVLPGWDGIGNTSPPTATTLINPYGYARAGALASTTGWINDGNFDFDVGVVTLSDRAVGMLTGWYGTAWGYDCDTIRSRTYNYAGYPAESCGTPGLHNGRTMYYWTGTIDSCPGNQLHLNTVPGCFTTGWGGMSGGPLYYQNGASRLVHAVDSNGDRSTNTNFAKLTQNEFDAIYNQFIPAARGGFLDLDALQARFATGSVTAGAALGGTFVAANPTNGSGNGTFTYRVYLSTNNVIDASDTLLSTQTFTHNFGPMSSVNVTIPPVAIPANTPNGNYYLGVVLDNGTDGNPGNNDTSAWDAYAVRVYPAAVFNDSCVGAPPIGLGTYTGNNSLASTDGSSPCGGNADVWYTLTVPASGVLRVNTCGSDFDTILSLHSACPGTSANSLICNDDSGAAGVCGAAGYLQSEVSGYFAAGTVVHVRVAGFNASVGNYVLNVSMDPPANDHCDSAIPMVIGSYSGDTRLADTDGAAPCGYSANAPDVWYSFSPPGDGIARLDTCNSQYDTVLSVHSGCPGTLDNIIACNDDVGNTYCPSPYSSFLAVPVQFGQTYYVRVSGFNGVAGLYTLNYAMLAPDNNSCYNVVGLTDGTTAFNNNLCDTDGPTEVACLGSAGNVFTNDMWYYYSSGCAGDVTVDTIGSDFDTILAAYNTGCPQSPNTAFACNDDSVGYQSRMTFHIEPGQNVWIRVGGYFGAHGSGVLNVAFATPCAADFNQDGGVDGGDVTAFFDAWEGGLPGADVNCDGGVDGSDIDTFFTAWENGGCN